jgi:aspartate aminotransferase
MPAISKRGISMPESPIRKLVPFANAAKKDGVEVYHLNIGQPDIQTPKIALDAIKNNSLKILAYSQSEGSLSFREKLSGYYASHQISVSPTDIIVTTGGSEALSFAFGSVMDPGDEVIIPEPFYANYNGFSAAQNVKVVPISGDIQTNFKLPTMEDFEKLIGPKTKAILICNPGNPTGYLYSKEEINKLAHIVKKHNLFLIADEVYREFCYDGHKHNSILSQRDLKEHAIIIDSVSKRYSMCGARIGCIVSKNQMVINTALKFAQARLSPPTYAQIASEAALDTPKGYFELLLKEYSERRNILMEELSKIEGVKVAKPNGAFYCIAELPVQNADRFCQWLLEKFRFNNKTVMLAPAAGFYATKGLGINQIRIAYVLKKEALKEAAIILREALKQYPYL